MQPCQKFTFIQSAGRLKLGKTGMMFKSAKTGKVDSIPMADIELTKWMRVARGFGIKVTLKNGQHYKYDGFKEVVRFLKKISVVLNNV